MESSLFALLIKGSVLRRSAPLHLAGNNDLFLPHHWASSISLGNKECSHGRAERGRLAALSLAKSKRARGVLTNGPTKGEASQSCLQPHWQTAASGESPELAHVIDKLPRKRLDPRWKTAHLSTDSKQTPASSLSFLCRRNSNRALLSLRLRDGQSLCLCAYSGALFAPYLRIHGLLRGEIGVMVPIGNAESSYRTQRGIVAALGGMGLAGGTGAEGRVPWTRMEQAWIAAFPKHRSNLLRHRLPEQKGRWGGNVRCLGIKSWLQTVPPAIEMAAVLPSEGVHRGKGTERLNSGSVAHGCWERVPRNPLGFLLTSEPSHRPKVDLKTEYWFFPRSSCLCSCAVKAR